MRSTRIEMQGRDDETAVGPMAGRACRRSDIGIGDCAGARRCHRSYRQIFPADVGEHRRLPPLQLAGVDRPLRLWHAERRVPAADDGAALVLAKILQLADAAFDLLLSRLC